MSERRLCACGCGKPVATGCVWRRGHYHTGRFGENSPNWRNGVTRSTRPKTIYAPENPRARRARNSHLREDLLVAEKAIGMYLPSKAEIFHIDGSKANSRNSNLVVCQDKKYHFLLKKRQRAYQATGNPHALQCSRCGRWGLEEDFNKSKYSHKGPCSKYLHTHLVVLRPKK
jgi:hypothetical protein